MLAIAFALVAASDSAAIDLVDAATSPRGCPTRLVGSAKHPFAEAQLACDAYLSFALVDEIRDGLPREPREAALAALLDDALLRGQASFRNLSWTWIEGEHISVSVLARGWLLMMMAGMHRVDALPAARWALFDGLAAVLVEDLARAEAAGTWLPSYRGGYWPCDHALAASALSVHGPTRSSPASTQAGRALAARLARLLDHPTGYVTQVDAKGRSLASTPRGTALAWTAAFLALGGHALEARAFARALDADFCGPLPLVEGRACREWPRGVDRAADAVSGPIFLGFGSGASALAIAAFRSTGDVDKARALEALVPLAPVLANVPDVRAQPSRYPLENAILHWGSHARSWTAHYSSAGTR